MSMDVTDGLSRAQLSSAQLSSVQLTYVVTVENGRMGEWENNNGECSIIQSNKRASCSDVTL